MILGFVALCFLAVLMGHAAVVAAGYEAVMSAEGLVAGADVEGRKLPPRSLGICSARSPTWVLRVRAQ